jgi:hypothetical protein
LEAEIRGAWHYRKPPVEWSPAAIICNAIPPRDPNDDDDEDDQDEEHEDLGDEPAIVREPDDDE